MARPFLAVRWGLDTSWRVLGSAAAARLFAGHADLTLTYCLGCGCDHQHVQAHSFPFGLGHKLCVRLLGIRTRNCPLERLVEVGFGMGSPCFLQLSR